MAARVWKAQWMVASFTEPEKEYKVSEAFDLHMECSCPAWRFAKVRHDCKHIDAVKRNRAGFAALTQIDKLSGAKQLGSELPVVHCDDQWIIRQVRDMNVAAQTAAPVVRKGREI